jgi:oligopeptide/dipeptide ABC transporter ATP-binding protein
VVDTDNQRATATSPEGSRPAAEDDVLLDVRNLKTYYPSRSGVLSRQQAWVRAVDDVSFTIRRGETFGLVGESGCGKSTLGRSVVRLEKAHSGQVIFDGHDVLAQTGRDLKRLRRDLQVIFQDPQGSLDPRMKVRDIIAEGLLVQGTLSRDERVQRVSDLASLVGLRAEHLDRHAHEFSGGQRQRIGIARALALRPKFVLADEPVSALDMSVQSQVLNLLKELQEDFGLTYLFIAHDLSVVEYISDRVGVMYLGKLVEVAKAEDLYADPRMPYTQALLSAIPGNRAPGRRERIVLGGEVPSPLDPPSGCRFRTRCWKAESVCAEEVPALREVVPDHWAACHFADVS